MQVDLSLHWIYMFKGTLCHVASKMCDTIFTLSIGTPLTPYHTYPKVLNQG